jgi:hypothetical protein
MLLTKIMLATLMSSRSLMSMRVRLLKPITVAEIREYTELLSVGCN